ncbi:MAG TPA: chalcone isomerase family protein [Polyangia bacterium]|jgi:hypothetical protein|nr:chalcone isomerase family protein [Polyangia bacterium]
MRTLLALAAIALLGSPALGLERQADGFYKTGEGIRVKKIAFIKIKVYEISHYMKELPPQKTKQAVIDDDVDKRFTWRMLRNVDAGKIKAALREAYAANGYGDAAKIDAFVNALNRDFKEGDAVTFSYDAGKKATTLIGPSGTVTVSGDDFMRATWKIWLGKIDQNDLGTQLIDRL